jgi:hypothetical protein
LEETNVEGSADLPQRAALYEINHREGSSPLGIPGYDLSNNGMHTSSAPLSALTEVFQKLPMIALHTTLGFHAVVGIFHLL